MKLTTIVATLVSLFLLSCSSHHLERAPGSIEIEGVSLSNILEFRDSGGEATSAQKLDKSFLSSLENEMRVKRSVKSNISVELQNTSELPEGVHYKILFEMDEATNQLKLIVEQSAEAASDTVSSAEVRAFLSELFKDSYFNSVYDVFEASLNAELGDVVAYDNFLKIRKAAIESLESSQSIDGNFVALRTQEFEGLQENLDELLEAQKKAIRAQEKERKATLSALDRLGDMEQLRGLVANGKRAEAADLIRQYLPWEKMAPMERIFWEENLKYMADPLPLEERMLVFRGIDGDMTYPSIENGKFLSREAAEEGGTSFLMSSILTKNQGTWNRRLRSLETMYGKVITQNKTSKSNDFTQSSRVSTMMYQHSLEPSGSPFLSYTPRISTAQQFGKQKMVALLLDPRVTYANFASAFSAEIEYLGTLVTFPDEMVGIFNTLHHSNHTPGTFFTQRLRQKLEVEYGQQKASKLTHSFMEEAKKMTDQGSVHKIETKIELAKAKKPGIFSKLYNSFKKLFSKGKTAPVQVPEVDVPAPQVPEKVSKCTNIIELFFKKSVQMN